MTKAKRIAVSEDGAVWCAGQDGFLYKRVGNGWTKNAHAHDVEDVTVGWEDNVWHRNSSGELYRASFAQDVNTNWEKVDTLGMKVTSISSAPDGAFWAVTENRGLLERQGGFPFASGFYVLGSPQTPVGDALMVSAGSDGRVVYLNTQGEILEQFIDLASRKKRWQQMPAPTLNGVDQLLRSVSYSRRGVIWAAGVNEELFKRQASPPYAWRHNGRGQAVQISTGGRDLVRCVNRNGDIFMNSNGDAGTDWVQIPFPQTSLPGHTAYTVRQGDTVSGIVFAKCPNLTGEGVMRMVDQVKQINGLPNVDVISVGQVLLIPACP